ncbi:hypothetical protein Vadar_004900 [Vaccinium darrowii]|uniref:Uncharacterized protein n=1 Tax=Vaccinium darrowii TaxID=229202 RepID=A0ACB7YU26_9ERIC|nr:hypothetical protein Vadar_004900 [Vaccinium darrowii]
MFDLFKPNIATMPKPLIFFLLLSLSPIFFFSNTSGGSEALASNCPSHVCGGVNISYPFWLTSDTTSNHYCGYPRFNLTCFNEETPIINLSGNSYYVKNISYTDKTLTLVDVAVTANPTCPRPRHNVTIQMVPLSYNRQDLNLSFYFNCSTLSGLEALDGVPPIECLSSNDYDSYVFVNGTETERFETWYDFCEEKVVVTVVDSVNILIEGVNASMKDGFVLDWRQASSCRTCEASKGLCGYNNSNEDFLCFCSDGSTRINDMCKGMSFFIFV